jgi:hypothetical protein
MGVSRRAFSHDHLCRLKLWPNACEGTAAKGQLASKLLTHLGAHGAGLLRNEVATLRMAIFKAVPQVMFAVTQRKSLYMSRNTVGGMLDVQV